MAHLLVGRGRHAAHRRHDGVLVHVEASAPWMPTSIASLLAGRDVPRRRNLVDATLDPLSTCESRELNWKVHASIFIQSNRSTGATTHSHLGGRYGSCRPASTR